MYTFQSMRRDKATFVGPFRVLVYQEGGTVLIQAVDFDIVTQGSTEEQAVRRFWTTIAAQILGDLEHGTPPLTSPARKEVLNRWRLACSAAS